MIQSESKVWQVTSKILTGKKVKFNLGNLYFGFLIDYIKKSKGWLQRMATDEKSLAVISICP